MASEGFQFKQFYVRHDRCAMKVGTDGVLMGCYAPVPDFPSHVLDAGTGSGLIALMVAQKNPKAQIDAIDIDEAAVAQANGNFAASPWPDRLHAYHSSLQDWKGTYDLVVSNPPYFQNSLKNPDEARKTARHTDSLSYEELLTHSLRLLSPLGSLAFIVPAEAEEEMRRIASTLSLPAHFSPNAGYTMAYNGAVFIKTKEGKPAKRAILFFRKVNFDTVRTFASYSELVLEDDKGGRSAAYQEITKDFYL